LNKVHYETTIKIHDTRIIRLLEVLLHGGNTVGGWSAKQIHQAVLTTFQLSPKTYSLNQLRYDLRKLRGHGLLQRDGSRYAYRITPKGVQDALLFLFFHKRLCGPLANSRFHHTPNPSSRSRQQTRACLLQSRQGHPKHRRLTRRCMMLQIQLLKYSCLRSLNPRI
jgi:hypothetical protein